MIHLRTVHTAGFILCGAALAFDVFDMPRAVGAALAIVGFVLLWSLEALRHHLLTRPEKRP
jgi:hypothetical protein